MTLLEVIRILEIHNLVRHGKMIDKPNQKELTKALKIVIRLLKQLN